MQNIVLQQNIVFGINLGYNMTVEALTNLSSTSDALVMSGNNLASSIMSIGNRLDMIRMLSACTTLTTICDQLPPSSIFQVGANFTQVSAWSIAGTIVKIRALKLEVPTPKIKHTC